MKERKKKENLLSTDNTHSSIPKHLCLCVTTTPWQRGRVFLLHLYIYIYMCIFFLGPNWYGPR